MEEKELLEQKLNVIQGRLNKNINHSYPAQDAWRGALFNESISISWSAEFFVLYGLSDLDNNQKGYFGEHWNLSWLVIADAISNPFIMQKDGKVYFARHGAGAWNLIEVSSSPMIFLSTIIKFIKCYYEIFDEKILDNSYEISHDFIACIKSELSSILNNEQVDNFIIALLG